MYINSSNARENTFNHSRIKEVLDEIYGGIIEYSKNGQCSFSAFLHGMDKYDTKFIQRDLGDSGFKAEMIEKEDEETGDTVYSIIISW